MGFGPTNGSLGSYCLTTWLHPLVTYSFLGKLFRIGSLFYVSRLLSAGLSLFYSFL